MNAWSEIPSLRGKEVIRALLRAGFVQDRQKGSHVVLIHPEKKYRTIVPVHGGETISKGLLTDILEQAHLTAEELRELL